MSADFSLALAFATGLFGALHCLGMCSGIAGGFFVHHRQRPWLSGVLLYHGSRILVYTVLGVAGATLGRVLVQTGLIGKGQGILMMAAGMLILLLGLDILGLFPRRERIPLADSPTNSIQVTMMNKSSTGLSWRPMLAGAFNGLVPCSLVFSVAVKAAASADPVRAGLLMASFGLGTLPTMGLVSWSGAVIGDKAKGLYARLAGLLVITLGLWTLYEGFVFFDIMRGLANW